MPERIMLEIILTIDPENPDNFHTKEEARDGLEVLMLSRFRYSNPIVLIAKENG